MEITQSNSRWFSKFSGLLVVASFCATSVCANGTEPSLKPFNANYSLYRNGMHVADSQLSLRIDGQHFHWRLTTEPRGLVSLFTRKRPKSVTDLVKQAGVFHLQQIQLSDGTDSKKGESAIFDWEFSRVDVLRKGTRSQLELNAEVFDYQAIHLLAARMRSEGVNQQKFDFYYKGKLHQSAIKFIEESALEINGEIKKIFIFEQTREGSNTTMQYSYADDNPALPLKIEKHEKDGVQSTMILKSVN